MQWNAATNFPIRHTMTNSSNKQHQLQQLQYNNTPQSTAAEVHGRHVQILTRTACSSVQYDYNLSGPGTLLWNRTRCLRKKKRNNSNNDTQSSSSGSGSSSTTMHAYKTDFSIAQTTPQSSYIFLHWHNKKKSEHGTRKKNGIPDSNHGRLRHWGSYLPVTPLDFLHT